MAKANKQAYAEHLRGLSDRALDQEYERVNAEYTNAVLLVDGPAETARYSEITQIRKEQARRKHEADVAKKLRD